LAVCPYCERDMSRSNACTVHELVIGAETYSRLRFGEERRGGGLWYDSLGDNCHDCNVAVGQLHHLDCDVEECPHCRDQLLACELGWSLVVDTPSQGRQHDAE
jgi:hypothetical protein